MPEMNREQFGAAYAEKAFGFLREFGYSLEERAKLVYRVEAIPTDPTALRPGQPVDVTAGARP